MLKLTAQHPEYGTQEVLCEGVGDFCLWHTKSFLHVQHEDRWGPRWPTETLVEHGCDITIEKVLYDTES